MERFKLNNIPLVFLILSFISFLTFFNRISFAQEQYRTVNSDTVTALFIGNSMSGYNQLAKMVENLGLSMGKLIFCDEKINYGTAIHDIWSFNNTKEKILEKDWTYIIIQADIENSAYPYDHHIVFPWKTYRPLPPLFQEIKEYISENKPGSQMMIFMPWAWEDGISWFLGPSATYQAMQELIYTNTLEFIDELQIPLAPVGWTWYHVVNQRPDIIIYLPDLIHPTPTGSYIAACVFYCSFFLEPIDSDFFPEDVSEENGEYIQSLASSIVLDNPELWKLTTTTGSTDYNQLPENFTLYQNYPNPFNPTTNISFNMAFPGHVNITIFDIYGQKTASVLDEFKNSGYHTVSFDAYGLSSGVYFYQLKVNNYSAVKKLMLLK